MTGRVFRRGATWSYVVDVGRDAHGRRRQRKRGGFDTKREAERALRAVLVQVDGQRYVSPSRTPLASYLRSEWLPSTRPPKVTAATWDGHLRRIERYIIPALGGIPLQDLNAAHLNRLYAELRSSGRADGGELSPRSVQLVHVTLRRALGDAVRWGLVARNVADVADRPATGRSTGQMTTWSPDELRTFLEHVAGDRLEASWVVAASTGMRRGEVLGLRWVDVDLDEGRLAVRSTRILIAGRVQTAEPKSRGSRRTVDLDERTVAALRAWRTRQLEERLRWGAAWQDTGLTFTREDGSGLDPRRWAEQFVRRTAAAGLPRLRPHDLRHTHATLMLRAGVSPKIVSERLGHSSVAFTLDIYSHVVPGMQSEAAEAVSRMVFGP